MPEPKGPYDILGVSQTATPEQIREAYLLRTKVFHPDRFDQYQQPSEWNFANELLKELNSAYATLRDPESRARYDESLRRLPRAGSSISPVNGETRFGGRSANGAHGGTNGESAYAGLKAGRNRIRDLPPAVRKRLIARISGDERRQFRAPLVNLKSNYIAASILLCWFVALPISADRSRWTLETSAIAGCGTALVAVLLGRNLSRILRWHLSRLRSWLIVTPAYVIKTAYDRVHYWPILDITDLGSTHIHHNKKYRYTRVQIGFRNAVISEQFVSKTRAEGLVIAIREFEDKARSAVRHRNRAYFPPEDDFRDVEPGPESLPKESGLLHSIGGYLIGGISSAGLFALAYWMNQTLPELPAAKDRPQTSTFAQSSAGQSSVNASAQRNMIPVVRAVPAEEEMELPWDGQRIDHTLSANIAQLKVRCAAGNYYLLKLVDSGTGKLITSVFIYGGSSAVIDVPLGKFNVRYSYGQHWFGYRSGFGPKAPSVRGKELLTFEVKGAHASAYAISLIPSTVSSESLHPEPYWISLRNELDN